MKQIFKMGESTLPAVLLVLGFALAAGSRLASPSTAAISEAQFEVEVEEGLGSFDQVPGNWAMLHQH
ncbi:MAG TPA: hypothetical protein VFC38_08180 [Stellaceae bacterium]|nr:hypothetical protein [Stellaceae bacterium]